MLKIGCHLSSSKGYLAMGKEAVKIGANTFQFFTRNPRGGKAKPLDLEDMAAYRAFAQEHGLFPILAHAPYTLNACAADEGLRTFARETMADDLARLENIPGSLYNFHPGSHVKQGAETGIALIAEHLNAILTPELSDKLGVCLDTCHVSDGGYDIVNDLDGVLEEFDKVIGLGRLMAVHLNDSMNPLGSHKDRHQKLGEGTLGLETLTRIINHPALRELPFYLETPNDLAGYAREIAMMKEAYQG